MGGGDNEIIISAVLDATGFKKGSQQLEKAVRGISASAKRLAGTIIGVSSAYQILSRAVSAYMSENQKLAAQMNSIWTALGNVLGPIINQIISWVTSAVSYFLEFLRLLGITTKTASQLSKKASGAGSELKKTIAGFDELNLLNEGGGGGGGANGRLEDKEAPEWIKDIADFLKQGEWEKAGTALADKLNEVIAGVNWKGIGEKIGYYLNGALAFIASFIKRFNWKAIGESIATLLNNVMYETDFSNLGTILAAKISTVILMLGGFLENLDFAELATSINEFAITFFDAIAAAIEAVDWNKIGEGIKTFFENLDYAGIAQSIFTLLGAALSAAVGLVWGAIGDVVMKIKDYFMGYINEYFGSTNGQDPGGEIVAGILMGILNALKDIASWVYTNMCLPFINAFKKAFGISSPSKLMEEQGGFIVSGLLQGLKGAWTTVTGWLDGLWADFSSALGGIAGAAWTWGQDLIVNFWNGINSVLGNFWDGITGIAQGIRDFLGFSEPKEGPLKDFHTFGPDMMKLYAEGIEQNKNIVLGAVDDLANGINKEMTSGDFSIGKIGIDDFEFSMDSFADKIVYGFEDLISRLEAIADNVTFMMPNIAGGGIVPYGVSGSGSNGVPNMGNEDTSALVNELIGLVDDFRKSVDSMQWVLQFGNTRAIVQEITKIQKQEERARG